LLILLYRAEYSHQWGSKSYYTKIGVDQLGPSSSAELLQALLEDGQAAPVLSELILKRASGNPLFIEEFTRALVENGFIERIEGKYVLNRKASDIQIPDTIQALIAARIDRLEDRIKRTLRVASVIGREFAFRILEAITEVQEELKAHLWDLQAMEFIYEKSLFPEPEYIFKHALIQEVAYSSLLSSRRKALHRKVGEAMESIFSGRVAEYTSIVGEHFLRGEAWEQAFYYLDRAGDAAARMFAHAEARMHFTRALKALEHLEDTEDNRRRHLDTIIKQTRSSWLSDLPEQNLKRLTEAERLAEGLGGPDGTPGGDPLRLARVRYWMGRVYHSCGEMREAIEHYHQVLPVAQESGDPELLAIPSSAIGQTLGVQGHLGKARELLSQAIPLFEQTANWSEWINAMSFNGSAIAGMGKCTEGVTQVRQARARAKEINTLTGISVSSNCLAFAHFFGGELSQAIEAGQKAVKAAEQSGDRFYIYVGYGIWGWAAGRAGQLEAAVNCMRRSQEEARKLGGQVIMADVFTAARAEIALHMGRVEETLTLAEQAVSIAQKMGGIWGEGVARRLWGQALTALPSPCWDEAETQLAESLRVLEPGQNWLEMARTHVAWGTLCREGGNHDTARNHWEQAAARFRASGITQELEHVNKLISAL
jgi:tetratricopeptide (TPR) repeat protein